MWTRNSTTEIWQSQKQGDMGKDLEKSLSSVPHSKSACIIDEKSLIMGFSLNNSVGCIVFFKIQFQK